MRSRRLELFKEQRRRAAEATAAAVHYRKVLSKLGQEAHRVGVHPSAVASVLEQAVEANRDHAELRGKVLGLASEHQSRLEQLERERATVNDLCRPFREAEAQAKAVLEQLSKTRRGIEMQKKRAEIELRNLDESIARQQQAYADPEKTREEKDTILRDITAFDNQRPPVLTRIRTHDEELTVLVDPLAEAELKMSEVRDKLAQKLEQIAGLDEEINRLSERFSTAQGQASQELEMAQDKADELWAQIGQRLLDDGAKEPAITEWLGLAGAASQEAEGSLTRRVIADRAVDAYDKTVFDKGKRILFAAAAAALLLVVLLVLAVAF